MNIQTTIKQDIQALEQRKRRTQRTRKRNKQPIVVSIGGETLLLS